MAGREIGSSGADDYCKNLVRQFDPDRYPSILFAPQTKRSALFALYAFSLEIARIRESTSDVNLAEIRLQWWRDGINGLFQGKAGSHPVLEALAPEILGGALLEPSFQNLIDARAFDLYDDPMPSLNDLEGYLGETASVLFLMATDILMAEEMGGPDKWRKADAAGHAGVAYGLMGLLRSLPVHRSRGQCYLPKDVLDQYDLTPAHILSARDPDKIKACLDYLINHARSHLENAKIALQSAPKGVKPAFLPLALVKPYADLLTKPSHDSLTDITQLSPIKRLWKLFNAARKGQI